MQEYTNLRRIITLKGCMDAILFLEIRLSKIIIPFSPKAILSLNLTHIEFLKIR
jgi:hypothetical protein